MVKFVYYKEIDGNLSKSYAYVNPKVVTRVLVDGVNILIHTKTETVSFIQWESNCFPKEEFNLKAVNRLLGANKALNLEEIS